MEPEGSLPCSQEPATGSYREPDERSPHIRTIDLSLIYAKVSQVVSFLQIFWLVMCVSLYSPHTSKAADIG
jgi:hypothetical protein